MPKLLEEGALDTLRELGGDFFQEVVETFLKSSREQMNAIRKAVADGDAGALEAAAHSLKGAGRQQGAAALAELCGEIERRGKESELAGIDPLLEKTEKIYRKTAEELKGLI